MKKVYFIVLISFLTIVSFAQNTIPKRGFAVDWIVPKAMSNPLISKFEKMELGLNLPDSISNEILNFIKDSLTARKLNPFDPDEIDIRADFEHFEDNNWKFQKSIYAFYFEDFKRNTSSDNMNDWNWIKLKTKDNFRIRYSPTKIGKWRFKVFVLIKNIEIIQLGPFDFTCENGTNLGYVKVSDNKHYLKLGENTFLPVGQNLPKPTCYVGKDASGKIIFDEYSCSKLDCPNDEEWCPHLRKLPMNPNAYMTYLKEIEKFSKAGANFYRMMIFPHTYEIEFDKLGNYNSRLNVAWELDQLVSKSETLNMKIDLNLFVGYPIAKSPYDVKAWDWYKENKNDFRYCYPAELNLKEPVEFLTNEKAKKHYKNKLRYIISRWGYSTAIMQFEMVSEINNKFLDYPKEIYEWHREMGQFIKEDLKHTNHLLSVSYDGLRPNLEKGDSSYFIPYFDVISHNIHRADFTRKSFQNCSIDQLHFGKPVIYGEVGTGDTELEKCDNQIEWKKDLWAAIFSGSASAGINWNEQHNYELWKNYAKVQKFINDINFDEFEKTKNTIRPDERVELLTLHSSDSTKIIGFIHNLTVNYFTNSNGGTCQTTFKPEKEVFQKFQPATSIKGKKGLIITGLKRKTIYVIEWFDPIGGEFQIKTEVKVKSKGKITLIHPEMDMKNFMYCFKLYPKEVSFSTRKKETATNNQVTPKKPNLHNE